MADYIGKICPYCKTSFKPDDEIVICSECGMPHHKDCWIENQRCTTFGCQGTIQSPDDTSKKITDLELNFREKQDVEETVFCAACGAQNAPVSSFCSRCGNRLTSVYSLQTPVYQQSDPANNNPYSYVNQTDLPYRLISYANNSFAETDLQQLVGTNTEYYMSKFREMNSQGKKTTWNWAAFLITPYWMIYRKMYAYGAAALGVAFFLSLIMNGIGSVIALGCYIAVGIYGNYIYMKFLENKIKQAHAMVEPHKTQFVANNSGVNTVAAILSAVGYAALIFIIS